MAARRSRFLPGIPGETTRRRTATSTRGGPGTVRGDKIQPFGCRVRQFHAKIRSGIGPTSRGQTTCRAGRSKRHPLTRLKKLRLRDLTDAPFVWFPRRANPAFYDQMILECYRRGLKSPRIV